MTKTVIETALDEEMSEHLGYDRHDPAGYGSGNSRNGTRSKTVLTDACGQIEINVPRDRAGTFEPQIVAKRQRRLTDVDEVVLSLYARGLTTGRSARISPTSTARRCRRTRSPGLPTGSRGGDDGLAHPSVGARVRRGVHRRFACEDPRRQVGPRPVYAAIGVDLAGHRDVLGMWAGEGDGESAKVLAGGAHRVEEPRGGRRLLLGLRRPQRIAAIGQCSLPRHGGADLHHPSDSRTFRYAGRQHRDAIARALKPIYTAVNATAATEALDAFDAEWGQRYRQRSGCGATPGANSSHSWTTTPR